MDTSGYVLFDPFLKKLDSIAVLDQDERNAIRSMPAAVRKLKAGQDIVREGDRPSQCCIVLDGFACRYKFVENGKRQIMSFHIAGDMPDLHSIHLPVADHSIGTLVNSKVAFIPHDQLRHVCMLFPRVAAALWRNTLIEAAIFREWMVGMGRRSAEARIAHLLCEQLARHEAVGLTVDRTFPLPVTQTEIGDALGLSNVHVNRVLKELREARLVLNGNRSITVLDRDGLAELARFEPTYLHFKSHAAVL